MKERIDCSFPKCRKKILARALCCNHYKALTKTRVVSDGQLLNYTQLKNKLLGVEDKLKRTLLVAAYLFASRKSETLLLKKKDFTLEVVEGNEYLICNSPVKKNRKERRKLFPINTQSEKHYANIILEWLKPLQDEDYLFQSNRNVVVKVPYSGRVFYKWCVQSLGIDFNPHWLRKLRCTHLINGVADGGNWLIPPQPSQIIRRLLGWTDLRPFRAYERFMLTDTIRALKPASQSLPVYPTLESN